MSLTAPPETVAAHGPSNDSVAAESSEVNLEQLYTDGEERFSSADFDGAIEAFGRGLEHVGHDERLRAYFSVSLAIAHLRKYDEHGKMADLERARVLLSDVVDGDAQVLAGEPRLEALARRNLARAGDLLALRKAPASARENMSEQGSTSASGRPPVKASAQKPVPETAPGREPRRIAGIGLLVSGTALVVGGLAVVVDGATLERRARAIAEEPPQGAQKRYIETEVPRLQAIRYAIGTPLVAVGIGLLIGGGVLLRKASRGRSTVLMPTVLPMRAGLKAMFRF